MVHLLRSALIKLPALLTLAILVALPSGAIGKDTRCFEMRVYHAAPGKLDALHARFRNHTTQLFTKHGMTNLGFWTPAENPELKLIYVLAYPNRAAREASWKNFLSDPDWLSAQKASEVDGALVAKIESTFMEATDFSPEIKASSAAPRVFELRTYTTTPGNLENLKARFRQHTTALFAKHGMSNLFYWNLHPDQPGADQTLVYLLAHRDAATMAASFQAFREDSLWLAAKEASEKAAGGSLTVPDGVKSLLLNATDYSETR
jgi:hypothetical protein